MIYSIDNCDESHTKCSRRSIIIAPLGYKFVGMAYFFKPQINTMNMVIAKDRTIHDVQQEFRHRFPFLKLEFYKLDSTNAAIRTKKHLPPETTLREAGLRVDNGMINIAGEMTVAEMEKTFLRKYNLDVQVSRKSGMIWLETTMTDKWSLQKQNEHGREISLTPTDFPFDDPMQGNG
jgi:hypothetical protein